jgi:5-methylcytosine-specific restriction endonuclease McrA
MRRHFSISQRVALFLHAQARCTNKRCGKTLAPTWHADHVRPYSKGGATDVINGTALCPSCNLKKGSKS